MFNQGTRVFNYGYVGGMVCLINGHVGGIGV